MKDVAHNGSDRASGVVPGVRCKNVLCWVSTYERREPVVEFANALAELEGGTCLVVLCMDVPGDGRGRMAPLTPEAIGAVQHRLSRLYADCGRVVVLPGHPVREIRRYARTHDVDVIVMNEQGLEVEREYAERIADELPCPVLTLVLPRSGASA